jgi:hypothetical protein
MKNSLAFLLLLLGLAASSLASAHGGGHRHHGGHVRIGVVVGAPLYAPWYYRDPYPYYPRTVIVPAQPPVYVEKAQAQSSAQPDGYWYYCGESQAYYPYVNDCPGGWQRLSPQPPAQ